MARLFRVGEFAALTGVSVRTLHHYDAIGLLRPTAHSASGYRLYSERDLLTLQQILTLRYLGFSLRQVRGLLEQPDFSLVASLQIQRRVLRDRIAELARIAAALDALLAHRQATGAWSWDLVARTTATVQDSIHHRGERTMETYYTPEQMRQWEELRQEVPAEEVRAIEDGWTALLADVRANRHLDPADPRAQALVDRWDALLETTHRGFRGREELWQAVGEAYRQGRFEGFDRAPQAEDFAFIARARAARGVGSP